MREHIACLPKTLKLEEHRIQGAENNVGLYTLVYMAMVPVPTEDLKQLRERS